MPSCLSASLGGSRVDSILFFGVPLCTGREKVLGSRSISIILLTWREGGETRSTATLHTETASVFPCPFHGERRGGSAQVPSNRLTLLVGEGGFPRSMSPTNPVGFPLAPLRTEASTVFSSRGGETRLRLTTCRCRGEETRRHLA